MFIRNLKMVLSGNVWFFKVTLKPEILLQFIYILAKKKKKSPKSSTKSHDVWSPLGELSELFYIFLLYQYSLSQFLISFVS